LLAAEFHFTDHNYIDEGMTLDRFGGCLRYREIYPPIGVGVQIIKAYFGIKDSGGGSGGSSSRAGMNGNPANKPATYEEANREVAALLDEFSAAGFGVGI
jgi:hypothetical protein